MSVCASCQREREGDGDGEGKRGYLIPGDLHPCFVIKCQPHLLVSSRPESFVCLWTRMAQEELACAQQSADRPVCSADLGCVRRPLHHSTALIGVE